MGNNSLYNSEIRIKWGWMIFFILLVYGMIFILNLNYPLFYDDWNYSFMYGSDQRIQSFSDIFHSQYEHYFGWGGRFVVHFICQALLMLDFFWICVINTLAYTLFIFLIYSIANKGKSLNPVVFLLCHLAVWFFQVAFCPTVLWKTGAANYLWGMLIVLLFIYPYYTYYRNKKSTDSVPRTILFLIAGVIAGWTNENVAIALCFYILVSIILYKIEKMKLPGWVISGFIGAIIGCLLMLAAPGNYVRLDVTEHMVALQGKTMGEVHISNIINLLKYSAQSVLPLVIAYIAGIVIYKRQNKADGNDIVKSSLLFVATGFVALFALMMSPASEQRAMFGIITLFIVPVVQVYANLDWKQKPMSVLNILMLSILILYYAVDYNWKYKTLKIVSTAWGEREPLIREYKAKGLDTITFTNRYQIHTKYGLQDLDEKSGEPINITCAKYYGFKWMRAVDEKNK